MAFAPSGKTFAVCRDEGRIDFFDPTTRKHQQSMVLKHDPKVNPNTEVGTFPALAFRPRPHARLGDVFAVTHKNGVNIGTTNIGLLVDNAPVVNDLPQNWAEKGFDPHQLAWLSDQSIAATNGELLWFPRFDGQVAPVLRGWKEQRHSQTVLAAIPDREALLCRFDNDSKLPDPSDRFDLWYIEPMAKVADPEKWRRISGHKSRPIAAAVSADGKRIVTGDEGGTLIVWEGEKFEEQRRIELGRGLVQLALAPDGKTVAAVRAYTDTTLFGTSGRTLINLALFVLDVSNPPKEPIPLWMLRNTLSDAKQFTGPASLAFSPDGKTLLAAFADPYISDKDAKSMGVKVWGRVPKK